MLFICPARHCRKSGNRYSSLEIGIAHSKYKPLNLKARLIDNHKLADRMNILKEKFSSN